MRLFASTNQGRRSSDVEGRLSSVETSFNSLHNDVEKMSTRMDSHQESIMSEIRRLSEGKKTDWSIIIAAVGMILTVLVLSLTPLIYKMQENTDHLEEERGEIRNLGREVSVLSERIQGIKDGR